MWRVVSKNVVIEEQSIINKSKKEKIKWTEKT